MLPRTLQPLAVVISVSVLVLLRLVPQLDPVRNIFSRGSTDENAPVQETENIQLRAVLLENERLKQELGLKTDRKLVRVSIINKTLASFRQAVKLSAGSEQGLAVNQAVFSRGYLIGIIKEVEPDRATALLIGDPDVRIPVVVGGGEGIVVPTSGSVIVDQVVGLVDESGLVSTSGVEGIYRPGLLLGSLGVSLGGEIFSRYVLNHPVNLSELDFVTVEIN